MDENEMLRDKVTNLERRGAAVSIEMPSAAVEVAAPGEMAALKTKLKETQMRLKGQQRDRERIEADKLAIFTEMNEAVQKLEAELKQEKASAKRLAKIPMPTPTPYYSSPCARSLPQAHVRAQARAKRLERMHHSAASDLALAQAELLRSGSPAVTGQRQPS